MTGIITREGLFDVQRRGLEEAGDKRGFAYFMEQGLGKTRTTLHEFHEKVNRELANVLVIVCPRSLRGAWRDESVECGYPYPIVLVDNAKKTLKALAEIKRAPVIVVMHYEQVLTHSTEIINYLKEKNRKIYLALDESVRIKNFSSVIGERLYSLASGREKIQISPKKSQWVQSSEPIDFMRVLSGTPAPQGPHDLWNQFRFLGEMEATPYYAFRNMYCKMGGFQRKQIMGAQNLDILRHRTGRFAFRAKKDDWTDLPEKIWMPPREIDLNPEQRKAYLEIMHEFVYEFAPDEFLTVEMAITVKNKLQQICSGWVYDNDKVVREIVPLEKNPKLMEVRDIIEGIDTKLIAFYFFKPTRGYLEQLSEKMGIGSVFLESGLSDKEFTARKRQFNEDDGFKVAWCQTDAVKEGHTLLGTPKMPCHNTLFVENTYSLYARAQGEDRNHRHGQKYPVNYWDIVSSREDKAIIKALQKKRGLQEAILSEFTTINPKLRVGELKDGSIPS